MKRLVLLFSFLSLLVITCFAYAQDNTIKTTRNQVTKEHGELPAPVETSKRFWPVWPEGIVTDIVPSMAGGDNHKYGIYIAQTSPPAILLYAFDSSDLLKRTQVGKPFPEPRVGDEIPTKLGSSNRIWKYGLLWETIPVSAEQRKAYEASGLLEQTFGSKYPVFDIQAQDRADQAH